MKLAAQNSHPSIRQSSYPLVNQISSKIHVPSLAGQKSNYMKELYKFCQAGTFCLSLMLTSLSLFSQPKRTLTARPNTVVDHYIHGYYESLPASYGTGSKQYPLLVFLHGALEIGGGSASEL